MRAPREARAATLVGLAGVLLAGVGDVLILARPVSGPDFDRATGLLPPTLADDRWRSLWNGVEHPEARVRLGTVGGIVGIGLVSGWGLGGAVRAMEPGALRQVATACVAVFAVAGGLTHHGCGAGVLRRRELRVGEGPGDGSRALQQPDRLLTVSAGATLAALAVLSLALPLAAHRRGDDWRWQAAASPFPWVLAALATTGRLPGPVGGYLRPASINGGLLLSLALAAARRDRPTGVPRG